MTNKKRVLILCTGNSARSIMGEMLLAELGSHRFEVASAGSKPKGEVHLMALEVLQEGYGIDAASRARSKPIEELEDLPFDLVLTVCDDARESCPVLPGAGVSAHWSLPDPAAVEDPEERRRAFQETAAALHHRLKLLCSLPDEGLADRELLEEIHQRASRRRPPT
jgi:arsenate reductase (thioredoxin)